MSAYPELIIWPKKAYPNPAKSSIMLETAQRIETVYLMNLNGGIIRTLKPGEKSAMIDLSDLIPGIYLLKIELEGGRSEFLKFILSK